MKILSKLDEKYIIETLKKRLNEKRLEHSINVMKMAVILAERNNVDTENAKYKILSKEEKERMAKKIIKPNFAISLPWIVNPGSPIQRLAP